MKVSLRRNAPKHYIRRIIIISVVVILAVFVLRPIVLGGVSAVNNSFFSIKYWLYESTGSIPDFFRDRNDLRATIDDLRSQLAGHSGDDNIISNLSEENKYLRSLVGSATSTRQLATIIGRPPQLPFDALLIDQGANAKISVNAPVYIHSQKAIGVVVEVFPNSSVVMLITSPGIETSVFVIGPDIYTTAVGMGGGVLQVNVPQGVVLEKGNLVVVPALGEGIYGEIAEVVSVPTEPVQYGFVTTDVPLANLRSVTVSQKTIDQISFEEVEAVVKAARLARLKVDIPDSVLIQVGSSTPTTTAPTTTPTED